MAVFPKAALLVMWNDLVADSSDTEQGRAQNLPWEAARELALTHSVFPR